MSLVRILEYVANVFILKKVKWELVGTLHSANIVSVEITFSVHFQTVNIPDAYLDPRFDPSVDEGTGFKHNTILCMAIKNSEGRIIGVIQVS